MLLWAGLALARPASIGSVDATAAPVRCHWQREADAARCADVLAWAEVAWAAQVDGLGFAAPLPDGEEGGSDALDVYLTLDVTESAGEAWVDCEGGDGTCTDADPTDGRAGAPAYVVIDARTSDEDLAEYVVHEFNHACQYATDYAEPFLVAWEGTAVAAQRWTLPDVDPSSSEVADFQATPWLSTVLQDGYFLEDLGIWSWYEYGAGAWVLWLDQAYGDGTGTVGPALWAAMTQEGYGAEPDVLDAWDTLAGDWRVDLLAFTADRARFGGEQTPSWLAWAGQDARAWREATGLGASTSLAPEYPPYPLGVSYFDLDVPAEGRWEVTVEGDDGVDWALLLVGADTVVEGEGGVATWASSEGETITVAVVNLGPLGLDADDALAPADFTMSVRDLDAPTGGTGEEDGGEEPAPGGCGCATAAPRTGLAGALGLVALVALRRRRPV